MTPSTLTRLCVLGAALLPAAAAAGPLQRYALVVGANNGGGDRARLQYAVSDAERFARVLIDLGGVDPENEIVLKEPRVGDLVGALDRLNARVGASRASAGNRSRRFAGKAVRRERRDSNPRPPA